ncbi:MAG: hypothetical protein JRJ46_10000 [Deltaproteobacteria bacterium]|nr:hypothetical protein [Deltaproteobacteria bacterium]
MSSKAYLIKRIEELEAKKKALEAPQSVTTARFDADPTPVIYRMPIKRHQKRHPQMATAIRCRRV